MDSAAADGGEPARPGGASPARAPDEAAAMGFLDLLMASETEAPVHIERRAAAAAAPAAAPAASVVAPAAFPPRPPPGLAPPPARWFSQQQLHQMAAPVLARTPAPAAASAAPTPAAQQLGVWSAWRAPLPAQCAPAAVPPPALPPPPPSLAHPVAFAPTPLHIDLPPEVIAALLALPPPGPGDVSADERFELLESALPPDALPLPAERPIGEAWPRAIPSEVTAACGAFQLLRALPGIWLHKTALREVLVARGAGGACCVSHLGDRRVGGFDILEGWQGPRSYLLLRFTPPPQPLPLRLPLPPLAPPTIVGPPRTPAAVAPPAPPAAGLLPLPAAPHFPASVLSALQLAAAATKAVPTAAKDHGPAPESAAPPAPTPSVAPTPAVDGLASGLTEPPGPTPPAAIDGLTSVLAEPPPTALLALAPDLPAELASALAALPPPGPGDASAEERAALLAGALPTGALLQPDMRPASFVWGRQLSAQQLDTTCWAIRMLRAVPGVWVSKSALHSALRARGLPNIPAKFALARIGGRRLGPYDVLNGRKNKSDYLLLRPADDDAAGALPPPPDAARGRSRAAAAGSLDEGASRPKRISARILQRRAKRARPPGGGYRETYTLSDSDAEGGSEWAPSREGSGEAAGEGAELADGAASAGAAEFEEGDGELRQTLLALIATLQAAPGCWMPGERLVDAARAQAGPSVGRCASEVLKAMGGQSLRACGCLLHCLPLPLCYGGSVYRLAVEDAGALESERSAAAAAAAAKAEQFEAAAALTASTANAAEPPRQLQGGEPPPAEPLLPPLQAAAPAGADAPICGDGQFLHSLRALLAHPDASALPGELAARTRGGRHEVPLAALFLAGLRAAGMPVPLSSISAAATGGGDSDGEDGGGGFAGPQPARHRAPPAVSAGTIAAFGEALRRACGVEIARIVRPAAQLPVPGLLVPVGQPSVAAWLWLSAAQPRALRAPGPCALDAAPASAPASDH